METPTLIQQEDGSDKAPDIKKECLNRWVLVSPASEQHGWNCPDNDPKIQRVRGVVNILQIQLNPLLEACDCASALDLPQTGQTRFHTEATAMLAYLNIFCLVIGQGAWADQAHIA